MCLYILCRTQGRDLYEFTFRDGCNVAVSLFSNIAVDAAGAALTELRLAAFNLRRDKLWKSLLSLSNGSTDRVLELLQVCKVTYLNDVFLDFDRLASIQNDPALFDPMRLIDYMTKDPAFSLSWQTAGSDGITNQHLYYMKNDDIYLMVSTFLNREQCRFELIERPTKDNTDQRLNRVVEKIVNSILYFIWSESGIS
jgi:hypothetical protein